MCVFTYQLHLQLLLRRTHYGLIFKCALIDIYPHDWDRQNFFLTHVTF